MPDLASRLRDYVDAAPPITLPEITRPRRSRRGMVITVAASLAVVVAITGALVAVRGSGGTHSLRAGRVHTSAPPPLPAACMTEAGCPMEPSTATRYAGFPIRVPTGIPAGWVRVSAHLRIYLPGSQPNGTPHVPTTTYHLGWAPPDVTINVPGCPTSLFISQRAVTPGEHLAGPEVNLGDGYVASGSIGEGTCGNPGGARGLFAGLFWIAHGVAYTLNGWNVSATDVLRIARSLNK